MEYNSQQKLRDNIEAIRIALQWRKDNTLSDDEVNALKRYAGFGGLKAVLFPNAPVEEWLRLNVSKEDLKLYPLIIKLHQLLHEHLDEASYKLAIDSIKNSILTAFYTPPFVPQAFFDILKEKDVKVDHVYEPSSGAGIFISEAVTAFPEIKGITAVEKDILSGAVLAALTSSLSVPVSVTVNSFENSSNKDNEGFDLVISNIPFGNFPVYDPAYSKPVLTEKIHNYFFAKGLDKIREGGLLAYITTDGFLNSPSNKEARKHLFERADLISLSVMPDNLMKDTGNTEAPSHFLIVQKNTDKEHLSEDEKALIETTELENEFGKYFMNVFVARHPEIILGDEVTGGKNQYGTAHQRVWQNGNINDLRESLALQLSKDIDTRFDKEKFELQVAQLNLINGRKLTYLPMPENKAENNSFQLGLFDTSPAMNFNRASAYIRQSDHSVIQKQTARIAGIIKTADNPEQESIVLLIARQAGSKQYVYKLASNVKEIVFPVNWMSAPGLQQGLAALQGLLSQFEHTYTNEGGTILDQVIKNDLDKAIELPAPDPLHKNGTLIITDGQVGFLSMKDNKAMFIASPEYQKDLAFYHQYALVRDQYLLLTHKEDSEHKEYPDLRRELKESYNALTEGYGLLNSSLNHRRILKDEAFGLLILSSLERKEGEQFFKADVLEHTLIHKADAFRTDDPVAALAKCLNDTGRVDIDFIAQATGTIAEEIVRDLKDHIFLDPANDSWETRDRFLSGNVIAKLSKARHAAEMQPDNAQIQRSLSALENVQPEKIPFELLDFNLGERWIPKVYYDRFATQLFELNTTVSYFPSLDTFKIKADGNNAKVNSEYAVTPKSGKTSYGNILLEHALENTTPFYTYEVALGTRTIRVPDNDAIQLAHQKIESIRNNFEGWLRDLPAADKNELEQLYNNTFNCYVLREYDGSHLQFPGLNKKNLEIDDLYSSQKNSVWRILQNRGALIDHEVGLGKTLTMIVAAYEMKRLGIVSKPMILALKANVNQIRDTYSKAYPHARLLAPGENDFTPAKRIRLSHEIKNNNWDCIILTHDQFGKIPQSPKIQQEIFQTELDNVEKDLYTLKEQGGEISRRMLKGLEIRKSNLEIKLKIIADDIEQKKDAGINFKDLGVDHVFVDESHKFKNLTFTTRHDRVAGLGNLAGSQKALNMLFAVRTLQDKFDSDLCATFLSGTPISNSLTEMYLLFKYLRPNEMRRQSIENFDAWAAVYARKTTDFEFSVTNEIVAKERFRHFIKVPELALFYNEITDYKTAKHIQLDKPELDEELVNIPPTPDQQEFIRNLMEFARTGDGRLIGRAPLTKEEDKGRMLIATNYAKKMAADMRLIDESRYGDHPYNKVNVCARKVADLYSLSESQKGTQIIFSDIGTPKPNVFNIYDCLKEKLITDFSIPSDKITFIHDWSDRQKPELFRKMNNGEIRILLGSTEKAGTGLNVQRKVIGMHHLDIPWKPSELEQRDGRGARQGNILAKEHFGNKVKNYIYAVEQSLDNYKFNLLKNKQTFISQMKNCELNVRTIDEGAIDESSGMNFSEYIAILSGDTSLLEKSKMEKKIAVLESLRNAHHKESVRSRFQLEHLQGEKKNVLQTLAKLSTDEVNYKQQLIFDADGIKMNPIMIDGLDPADADVIGSYLINLSATWRPKKGEPEFQKIGKLYAIDLFVRRQQETYEEKGIFEYRYYNTFYAESSTGIKYNWNHGQINIDNPKIASRHFLNAIDRVGSIKEKYEKNLKDLNQNIPMLEQLISKPFEKEEDLIHLKRDVANLEREISIRIQEKQMKQQQGKEENTIPVKEAPVMKIEESLLPKKESQQRKEKSIGL